MIITVYIRMVRGVILRLVVAMMGGQWTRLLPIIILLMIVWMRPMLLLIIPAAAVWAVAEATSVEVEGQARDIGFVWRHGLLLCGCLCKHCRHPRWEIFSLAQHQKHCQTGMIDV